MVGGCRRGYERSPNGRCRKSCRKSQIRSRTTQRCVSKKSAKAKKTRAVTKAKKGSRRRKDDELRLGKHFRRNGKVGIRFPPPGPIPAPILKSAARLGSRIVRRVPGGYKDAHDRRYSYHRPYAKPVLSWASKQKRRRRR